MMNNQRSYSMKYLVILLVLIGISLSYHYLPDAESRIVSPLYIVLEDDTIKQNSFIVTDSGVPIITIQKEQTISFPLKIIPSTSESLPVNFVHMVEHTVPETRKSTLPDMKIEFAPFHMVLKPDEPQLLNVTITTLNYTHLGEHTITVTAQEPHGEALLNTRFDVLVITDNKTKNVYNDFKYPVPGNGIIANLYSLKVQIESNLRYDELRCNEGHILIQKYDGSPACVKPETKAKLIERGWTDNITKYDVYFLTVNGGYDIPYSISGAVLSSITADMDESELVIKLDNSTNDGNLIITLPRTLIDRKIGNDDGDFVVMINNTTINFKETRDEFFRTLEIPFVKGIETISIASPHDVS